MNTSNDLNKRPSSLLNRLICLLAIAIVATATTTNVRAGASAGIGGPRGFTYFNANLYVGAELLEALSVDPNDPGAVIAATSKILANIIDSHPEIRVPGVARTIAAQKPDVVGLVEVYTVATASVTASGPGQFTAMFDYLKLLTNTLAAEGAHYRVEVIATESDVILPVLGANGLLYGRLTDHEVILVRSDLPPGQLSVSNPQTGKFSHYIQVPDLGISIYRGWCSMDIFTTGERIKYVLAHPEQQSVPILNFLQIRELLEDWSNTTMPIVLAGDFNADSLHRDGTTSYDLFGAYGFKDGWLTLNPGNSTGGLTWGHDAALANPSEPFSLRIDLVLYRGAALVPSSLQPLDVGLNRNQAPLWATDHTAVLGSFGFAPPKAKLNRD